MNKSIQSLLGVPLISYDNFLGILYAVSSEEYGFTPEDLNMLRAFADQAAVALENARLVEESIVKEKLEQELKIAHDAQMKLLPKSMPSVSGLEMDAICVTANEVGGDYYDFFELDDSTLGIVIGDVSGKGPEAAFYMAEVKGIIESLSRIHRSPKELLIQTNEIMYQNFDKGMFVTLIYAVVDMKKRKMTFCRAGHCPLLHLSAGGKAPKHIEPGGLGVGLEGGEIFRSNIEEKTISLKKDDIFLFYTDGIIESMNADGEEFGESRLSSIFSELKEMNAPEIRDHIIKDVTAFAGAVKPHDDLSMVVVRVK
jgi:serine phosphatase RsbU (regulator of sigma subunit)